MNNDPSKLHELNDHVGVVYLGPARTEATRRRGQTLPEISRPETRGGGQRRPDAGGGERGKSHQTKVGQTRLTSFVRVSIIVRLDLMFDWLGFNQTSR